MALCEVFNCSTRLEEHIVHDPVRLGWESLIKIEHYHVGAEKTLKKSRKGIKVRNKIKKIYLSYVNLIVDLLKTGFEDKLISVVLYGSVARGEAGEGSDIDLLIIAREFEGGRFEIFNRIEKDLRASDAYRNLKENNLRTLISPVPLTPSEIRKNPPILLDIITDGIILYDTEDFMKNRIDDLKKRLEVLGSKKVFLGDGKYYWDLKPDYKFGEIVEI